MSATIGYVTAVAQYGLDSILIRPKRAIGSIIAQVTIEEVHHDEVEITDHPVEQGATVSDHAYLRPAELVIKAAWSNSPSISGLITGVVQGVASTVSGLQNINSLAHQRLAGVDSLASGNSVNGVRDIYAALLKLQSDRQPFSVMTGKRSYDNMLVKALTTTTDKDTEHALTVTVTLRQVIVVRTRLVTITADALNQRQPASTQPLINNGIKQLSPSSLYDRPRGGS